MALQAAVLAEVALALVTAETLEDVEQELFARGLPPSVPTAGPSSPAATTGRGGWRSARRRARSARPRTGCCPPTARCPPPGRPGPAGGCCCRPASRAWPSGRRWRRCTGTRQHRGWAFLPLRVGPRTLGSLAVAWNDEHQFTATELDLLDGFAGQCAQAVLRIEAKHAERTAVLQVRRLAEELQHALLTPPPEPDHLQVVVRYHAASGAEVGGDWYDAFQQPDGATMLVIGDVVGHDSRAAAGMGQLRGVLRTLAYDADGTDHDGCAAVLTRTEHTLRGLAVDALATAVLARIERIPDVPVAGTRLLRWSNAGHLPPVVLAPDGSSRLLEAERGPDARRRPRRRPDRAHRRAAGRTHPAAVHRRAHRTARRGPRRRPDRAADRADATWGPPPWTSSATPCCSGSSRPTPRTTSLWSPSAASRRTNRDRPRPALTGPLPTSRTSERRDRPGVRGASRPAWAHLWQPRAVHLLGPSAEANRLLVHQIAHTGQGRLDVMSGPVTGTGATPLDVVDEPGSPGVELSDSRDERVGHIRVRRALPRRGRRTVGAWCFADHMGPADVSETSGLDIGAHPHIGLQTVTWLVEGQALHRDSLGSEQLLSPGELNLMSAGRGVSHSEEATGHYRGRLEGLQLWIAQPEQTRDSPPDFEHHGELPRVELDRAVATVLIGELAGGLSPARNDTPLVGADLTLDRGGSAVPLRPDWEYALVVLRGAAGVEGQVLEPGRLAYLGTGRDELGLDALEPTRAVLLGGEPLEEQLVMWWNFVGRSRDEISLAYDAWQRQDERFGRVRSALPRIPAPPPYWTASGPGA